VKQIRTFGGSIVHVDEVVNQFLRTLDDEAKLKVLQSTTILQDGSTLIVVTVVYEVIPK
jgi:hypothetical protein